MIMTKKLEVDNSDSRKHQEILGLGWDFDYVMNISESDYPVRYEYE